MAYVFDLKRYLYHNIILFLFCKQLTLNNTKTLDFNCAVI